MLRKEPYGRKVDVWALGCLVYSMAALRHPFEDAKVRLAQRLKSTTDKGRNRLRSKRCPLSHPSLARPCASRRARMCVTWLTPSARPALDDCVATGDSGKTSQISAPPVHEALLQHGDENAGQGCANPTRNRRGLGNVSSEPRTSGERASGCRVRAPHPRTIPRLFPRASSYGK